MADDREKEAAAIIAAVSIEGEPVSEADEDVLNAPLPTMPDKFKRKEVEKTPEVNEVYAYLLKSVHEILKVAVCEMIISQPADPIEFIAEWLYAYRGTTRQLRAEELEMETRQQLEADRKAAHRETKKLRAEAKYISTGSTGSNKKKKAPTSSRSRSRSKSKERAKTSGK